MAKKDLAPHFLLSVGQLPGRADHFLQAPVVVRMGIEQPVVAAGLYRLAIARSLFASEVLLVLQHPHHLDHRRRIVAGAGQVLSAETIGFQFHVTPVAADEGRAEHVGQVAGGTDPGADRHRLAKDVPGAGLALLAHAVARRDVADLMTEHRGQFGLGAKVGDQSAMDIDVAARQGEGVDVRRIDDGEMILQIAAVAAAGDPLAYPLHVGLELFIVVAGNCLRISWL